MNTDALSDLARTCHVLSLHARQLPVSFQCPAAEKKKTDSPEKVTAPGARAHEIAHTVSDGVPLLPGKDETAPLTKANSSGKTNKEKIRNRRRLPRKQPAPAKHVCGVSAAKAHRKTFLSVNGTERRAGLQHQDPPHELLFDS